MSGNMRNKANGVLDIAKESGIVANLVIADLMDTGIILDKTGDIPVEIASKQFLTFRTNAALSNTSADADIEDESGRLAQMMVASLMAAGFIKEVDRLRAFEIAEEEIRVRRSMESL